MMKSRQLGLIMMRLQRDSPVYGLRNLPEMLGPVKSRTFRQASRIANTFRAGHSINEYEELKSATVILVCASDDDLAEIVRGLLNTGMRWFNKTVLLCGRSQDSNLLRGLAEQGAAVGSLDVVAESDRNRYIVEGDALAVREATKLVEGGGERAIEVNRSGQRLCSAGLGFASWLMAPLIDASMRSLRHAGLTPSRAAPLIRHRADQSVRGYLKGGPRSWKPPKSVIEKKRFLKELEVLRDHDPALAEMMRESARMALHWFGRGADWIDTPGAEVKRAAAGK